MGTAITVDIRDAARSAARDQADPALEAALEAFFAELRSIEAVFSPWLPDSEISRISDGRLARDEASPDVRFVLSACDHLTAVSGGAFDVGGHRPDGRLDPSAYVKGWAVEESVRHLDDAGLRDYAVNAGGDILCRGDAESGSGAGWRVGVRDPEHAERVVRVLRVRGLAVATSGLYERGAHIRDPRHGDPRTSPLPVGEAPAREPALTSLTVVGPSLGWADAYATTGFVLGAEALDWVDARPGYGAFAIWPDRRIAWTTRLDSLLQPVG
jgi:thiamine biosynthesis lipoprotein